jgi:hypothetical protein
VHYQAMFLGMGTRVRASRSLIPDP